MPEPEQVREPREGSAGADRSDRGSVASVKEQKTTSVYYKHTSGHIKQKIYIL